MGNECCDGSGDVAFLDVNESNLSAEVSAPIANAGAYSPKSVPYAFG